MPIINPHVPVDGDSVSGAVVGVPFNAIIGLLNGGLDYQNIAVGGITAANLAVGVGRITGEILLWGSNTPPSGWLICDGSSLLRSGTYANLFAIIGTTFGTVDGTHFTLPNFKVRTAVGYDSGTAPFNTLGAAGGEVNHTLTTAELAVHSHGVSDPGHTHVYSGSSGTLSAGNTRYAGGDNSGTSNANILVSTTGIGINNAGSGSAHNNMPPYVVMNYIIKI